MIRAYIAGPFRGPDHWAIAEHVRAAERTALAAWALGLAAFCPHANTAHFQGALPDAVWLEGDIAWLRVAEVVIVLPYGDQSDGTIDEVREALACGLPVFWAIDGEPLRAARQIVEEHAGAFVTAPATLGDWLRPRGQA